MQADGIVGATIKENSHGWGSHVIEYFAVGTSIMATRADHTIPHAVTGAAAFRPLTPQQKGRPCWPPEQLMSGLRRWV